MPPTRSDAEADGHGRAAGAVVAQPMHDRTQRALCGATLDDYDTVGWAENLSVLMDWPKQLRLLASRETTSMANWPEHNGGWGDRLSKAPVEEGSYLCLFHNMQEAGEDMHSHAGRAASACLPETSFSL